MITRCGSWLPRTSATLCAMLSLACTGARSALRPQRALPPVTLCREDRACADTVLVTYLGVDGFLIRRGTSAVMTSPLFTHRRLFATIFNFTFRSDTSVVDRSLAQLGVTLGDVSMVLAGHSHYDHLLDVPYIARKYLRAETRIVGSPSMKHILAGDIAAAARALAIGPDDVGDRTHVGRWIYAPDGRSRVMALASSHAANWLMFMIAPGTVSKDRTALPRSAWGWKVGEVYAYVVDFIRADSTPEFRLFFQDAVSRPEFNELPPFEGRDVHAVNLAIVCAGNFNKAPHYPDVALDRVRPERVVVGHWDNFFAPWTEDPEVVPFMKTKTLATRLEAHVPGRWVTPLPGAVMRFAFAPAR